MCREVEKLVMAERNEGRLEEKINSVRAIMESLSISVDEAPENTGIRSGRYSETHCAVIPCAMLDGVHPCKRRPNQSDKSTASWDAASGGIPFPFARDIMTIQ